MFGTVDSNGVLDFEVALYLEKIEPLPGTPTKKNVLNVPPAPLGDISLTLYFSPTEGYQQV